MALLTFNAHEARTAAALFERMFPADATSAGATQIGVVEYLDLALAGAYRQLTEIYRVGLHMLDQIAHARHGAALADCTPAQQDALIAGLEAGTLPGMRTPPQQEFFALLRAHLQEGLFADPAHGGNRDKLGWTTLGHPGVWLENSAEENLSAAPADKGGQIQSLADLGLKIHEGHEEHQDKILHSNANSVASDISLRDLRALGGLDIPGYDPQRGALPPSGPADVLLVGLGAMNGLIAPLLTRAGLKVVALEAGPYRTRADFLPDELGAAYYCRATMGPKFMSEVPRWRRTRNDETIEATFSLGRMVNSVGGSVIHYGAWLRRFHPHHFKPLSRVRDRWGAGVLPEGCMLADWPVGYDELEPYYALLERLIGVAGDDTNPFVRRSTPYPMPPLRPFRLGEAFRSATEQMGLHPHPVPVGVNSVPYDGRPATTYTAWSNGFGSYSGDKWHPGLSSIPEALASGNLDLRTHCRVTRVLTDRDGHASGVEYLDANGVPRTQAARTVLLGSYLYENVRLLLLSGDGMHPNGLGNNTTQVGRNYMTKMFAHVDGFFPDTIFNRHTGPAAQGMVLDDFVSDEFDSLAHGFIGGATLGAENQFLPIQISREALPADVPLWGQGYKDHLRQWQHFGVVRIQPDALPYAYHTIDLDPRHRDRSGLGLPVVRITYDLQENERRLSSWMEATSETILRAMGATKTWRGPSFTGVGSSHDFGACRMGDDPATSVVDGNLRVHDTPGLYVLGGATFPSCPGINPTLTMWAICYRAVEHLAARLRNGEEV
ncbi:MAG TPA: GMC family oxidoreductase [Roseiflexaceae bacterium]|nr:GMC family oxidoreductase [Roseiflexaceae bacterium]